MKFPGHAILAALLATLFNDIVFADSPGRDLVFQRLGRDDGLSQSTVTCILQDRRGFLWFGTADGLNMYDGYTFKIHRHNSYTTSTLSDNSIICLGEDSRGRIWIGTAAGLNLYDPALNKFEQFHDDHIINLNRARIEALAIDESGNLWFAARGFGLTHYNVATAECAHYGDESMGMNEVSAVFCGQDEETWVGSWRGHLNKRSGDDKKFVNVSTSGERFCSSQIIAIQGDNLRNIWVGTVGEGLFQIQRDLKNGHVMRQSRHHATTGGLSANIVLSLLPTREGNLWIGTENEGLDYYDANSRTFINYKSDPYRENSLSHNSIWSLFEDDAGTLWVGTFAGGINVLYKNQKFRHYKHRKGDDASLSMNAVSSFLEDTEGRIWVGTDGGGLNLFDREQGTFKHYKTSNCDWLASDAVTALLEDRERRIWVGTWGGGIHILDKKRGTFKHLTAANSGLAGDNVLSLAKDRHGNIWVASNREGISEYKWSTGKFQTLSSANSGLIQESMQLVYADKYDNIWIGGEKSLTMRDPMRKNFTLFVHDANDDNSLSRGSPQCFLETTDSTLWVGLTNGLSRFERRSRTFVRYGVEEGLPGDAIRAMVEDNFGNIWIATNNGVSKYSPRNNTFRNYLTSDGLQSREFYRSSGYKTRNEEIYFGGINGFNAFYPQDVKDNQYNPPVVFTDFLIYNRPIEIGMQEAPLKKDISATEEIVLHHNQSVVTFEFAALNFISPAQNQYAYKLENFEHDWNFVAGKRTATYTNLDPGEYFLRVKGSNNDGIWNENGATMKIVVMSPPWKTWWAFLLYTVTVLGATIAVFRAKFARERLKNALALEHLELEKLHEMDQMKARFFTNVSHEFRTPLSLILGPLEELLKAGDLTQAARSKLDLIRRSAGRLLGLTNQLLDLHKLEAGDLKLSLAKGDLVDFMKKTVCSFGELAHQQEVVLNFSSKIPHHFAWFDPDKLEQIVYNLLSNAVKFTPSGGTISVELTVVDSVPPRINSREASAPQEQISSAKVTVQDTGIGMTAEEVKHIFKRFYQGRGGATGHVKGSGIGMALTYELVQLYHGDIHVASAEGQGTKVEVTIPLERDVLEKIGVVEELEARMPDEDEMISDKTNRLPRLIVPARNGKDLRQNTPRILIVEDDADMQAFLQDAFDENYRLILAENGVAGWEKATETVPDLIITDIMMPKMDGLTLCTKLKTDIRTCHIPVIMLTARASDEHRLEGIETGAEAYILKPFKLDFLRACVTNLLETRRRLKERFSEGIFFKPEEIVTSSRDEDLLKRILKAVEENLSEGDFNAESLCKEVGLSKTQLYRKIKGLTNQTVHEFIRTVRLKKAAQLLVKNQRTITEVAFEVGFNDLTYFARCFRKQFRMSPSEYLSQTPHKTS